MRSPSSAPPDRRLEGSTDRTATLSSSKSFRNLRSNSSTRLDFPEPPVPVIPTTGAPEVAAGMNRMPKFVFSRTLHEASWSNTTLVQGDLVTAVRALKLESGPDMVILGSGRIVAQLAPAGVIDEYQVVVNPIVLGRGRLIADTKLTFRTPWPPHGAKA